MISREIQMPDVICMSERGDVPDRQGEWQKLQISAQGCRDRRIAVGFPGD